MKTASVVSCLLFLYCLAALSVTPLQAAGGDEKNVDANSLAGYHDIASFGGPASTDSQLREDDRAKTPLISSKPLDRASRGHADFKASLREKTGLTYGLDYTAFYQAATAGLTNDVGSSGIARLFGQWELVGRGSEANGSLVYKVEHRHRIVTDISPQQLGPAVGYAGLTATVFSDANWMLSNLYWRHNFSGNRLAFVVGVVDYTDYVDMYGLINPWTDFGNLVFANNPTIPALNQGLGGAVRYRFTDQYYLIAGLQDANGDPTDPAGNVETFFEDTETLKHAEFGWISSWEKRYYDNIHITAWQADSFANGQNPSGWGLAASACYLFGDHWMPFLRAGYSDGGASAFLKRNVTIGTGYLMRNRTDAVGFGLGWGRPSDKTFGPGRRDQYTAELYYRIQFMKHVALTPDIQVLKDPALNPEEDLIAVFGLRGRVAF